MFVDKAKVQVQAGKGGDGIVSFRHEKFIDRGGPNGGDGGDGGDVVLVASTRENTLASFRYQKLLKADDGKSGAKSNKHGKSAKDLEILVPVGTVVLDKKEQILADLTVDGQKVVIAKGGNGGFGNAHFVSSRRQAPRVAEKGEQGEQFEAILELKMLADVGLVGLPNAGKSTLLSVISNARPEIADYAFTTLTPNLGVVDIDESTTVLVADIPGLIEGASKGKGLGDEFLRHVERTKVLVHLIDIYSKDIIRDYKTINAELAAYKVDMSSRPQIVALTKVEGLESGTVNARLAELQPHVAAETPLMALSAQGHQGLKELFYEVKSQLQLADERAQANEPKISEIPVITLKVSDDDWQITETENAFIITGIKIERFAGRTRFGDYHAEERLRDIIGKQGIMRELQKRGIKPDQVIIFGESEIGRLTY